MISPFVHTTRKDWATVATRSTPTPSVNPSTRSILPEVDDLISTKFPQTARVLDEMVLELRRRGLGNAVI